MKVGTPGGDAAVLVVVLALVLVGGYWRPGEPIDEWAARIRDLR